MPKNKLLTVRIKNNRDKSWTIIWTRQNTHVARTSKNKGLMWVLSDLMSQYDTNIDKPKSKRDKNIHYRTRASYADIGSVVIERL